MVWNKQLKREIPVGWEVVAVPTIVDWESNSQPPKSEFAYEYQDGYVRFIQNRDYDSDDHITYIPLKANLVLCDKKDILIDKYGDAGRVRYGIYGAFNVALAKLNVKDKAMLEYVRCFFEANSIYNYLHSSCMASTRASLNSDNVANLYICIPVKDLIYRFNKQVDLIRDKILLNADETRHLITLRNWLLPLLMNGQATIAK